jgi:hypothetical protein
MKSILFSVCVFFALNSVAQLSIKAIGLNWDISEHQLPKTDSIDVDNDGNADVLIQSYFYDYWNGVEILMVNHDNDFSSTPWIRVVNNWNNLSVQECDASGSISKSVYAYVYTDNIGVTNHQNKTVVVPLMLKLSNGFSCGNMIVVYSGNNIEINSIVWNNGSENGCNCSLSLSDIDSIEINKQSYNLLGQPIQNSGLVIENRKLNYYFE